MKNRFILSVLLVGLMTGISSCKDDKDDIENPTATESQKWVEKTMRKHYYWNDEIPQASKLNYTKDTKDFFYSLLSKNDGKDYSDNSGHYYYSTIKELSAASRSNINEENSYGFEYTGIYAAGSNSQFIYAVILYVLKDSPADVAGLKRGDWIMQMNDHDISQADFNSLASGNGVSFTISRWNATRNMLVKMDDKITLSASHAIEEDPVLVAKTLYSPVKGQRIGYLVYTRFEDGKTEGDTSYDDELRNLSKTTFNGVEEFVLDLRYNNGGLLSSALLLCSILEPNSALDQSLGYLKYNDGKKESLYNGRSALKGGGSNLNLKTLYVLVGNNTASASEMVINSLKPYMNVILIGEKTEGKNVGSLTYTSDDKAWEMHPIVCQIYNSKDFTDYAYGFKPDINNINEAFAYVATNTVEPVRMYELGNPNEWMLNIAVNMIDGVSANAAMSRAVTIGNKVTFQKAPYNSISRKATNGVIIDKGFAQTAQ